MLVKERKIIWPCTSVKTYDKMILCDLTQNRYGTEVIVYLIHIFIFQFSLTFFCFKGCGQIWISTYRNTE